MWERLWENLVDGACAGGEEAEAFDVLVPFHFPSQAGQPAGNTLSARKSSRALAMRYPVLAQAVPLLASQPPEERGRSEAGDRSQQAIEKVCCSHVKLTGDRRLDPPQSPPASPETTHLPLLHSN